MKLILDAGALIAVDRNDARALRELQWAADRGVRVLTSAAVVAQVWRDASGRQAMLARLLRNIEVAVIDREAGQRAGLLLGQAGTDDVVDAALVLLAEDDDVILTSDPEDIQYLLDANGVHAAVLRS